MAENPINPLHNIHKKYRTMNFVNHYIFTPPVLAANTFIGGVASTINTAALLATKLAIDVSRITNFSVVGSDIQCRITGSYSNALMSNGLNPEITYYRDVDGLIGFVGYVRYYPNLKEYYHPNATGNIIDYGRDCPLLDFAYFPNATFLDNFAFRQSKCNRFYVPKVTSCGSTVGDNGVFDYLQLNNLGSFLIYCHPSLATNNAGQPDGDIQYCIANGYEVRYVNFTVPTPITNLNTGTVYATAIQLNFTAPTGSANAIEFYECYVNGVYKNTITASGGYITGLLSNTSYSIEVKPVDIFYNKSTSNTVTQTTASIYYTDADANAYISAASLTSSEQESAYKLIVDLKTNNLWTKIQAIYPFKGTTAAQHKWNAKNPLDTNAAFRLNFFGTSSYSNLGYQLNGTNAFANSNFIPSANQNVNNNGVTIVVGTNNAVIPSDAWEIGAYQSNSQTTLLRAKENNSSYAVSVGLNTTTYATRTGVNDAKGIITGSKTASNVHKLIKNGVVLATSTGGGSLPSIPLYIGALNFQNTAVGNYSTQRIQMAIIHEGLSDAEVATLHSIIDLSESIAGRKTW